VTDPQSPQPSSPVPVFDGHNDTILNLMATGRSFFERSHEGHIDLPRAREGGLLGGFFAVFIRDPEVMPTEEVPDPRRAIARYSDSATMPAPMELDYAQRQALRTLGTLVRLEDASDGAVRIVRSASDIRACLEDGAFALELHFEGAEAIDPELTALDVFHRAGLRSLGLTWSRPNRFAHGVHFGAGSPDTGPGLTELGKDLVRACNRLRILIDLSHLNEQGFWDVAALSDAPLVATHSNAHAVSPQTRNLTDKQLDAIRESDGLVGLNFHVGFLRPDSASDPETPLGVMADHLDYLIERLGEDRVGLGSDFDGATMPKDLADASQLPNLFAVLRERGYGEPLLRKIGYENWLRVLEKTWGE
jgi:membrane dipeptidase